MRFIDKGAFFLDATADEHRTEKVWQHSKKTKGHEHAMGGSRLPTG